MDSNDNNQLNIDLDGRASPGRGGPSDGEAFQLETSNQLFPVLGLIAVALLAVGVWTLLRPAGTDAQDEATETSPAVRSNDDSAALRSSTVPAALPPELPTFEILQDAFLFDSPIVLLPILEGSRIDNPLVLVIEQGVLRYRSLKTSLWTGNDDRVIRLNPGAGPHPMVVGSDQVAIATLGGIHTQDLGLDEPSQAVAQGISILPSTTSDDIWVVGNSGNNVALVDLATGEVRADGSLAGFGYPLGAVANGLLVGPNAEGAINYSVWAPGAEALELAGTGALKPLGYSRSEAFFDTGNGLAVFDLLSGELLRTVEIELPEFGTGTLASPDGSRLAVSFQPSVIENNTIVVFDTTTGEATTSITDALPWQFQWADGNRLLYMQSDFPTFRIALHDFQTDVTSQLVEFDDFSWWFATTSPLGE